jgi:hypothetical protein
MLTVVLPADTWETGGNYGVDFNVVRDGVRATRGSTGGFALGVLSSSDFGSRTIDWFGDGCGFLLLDFSWLFGNND